jgi:Transposase
MSVVTLRLRRLVCPTYGCRQTFREQVPGVLERYRRRTPRLDAQIGAVARELAGHGAARLLAKLAVQTSRHSTVRSLLWTPVTPQRIRDELTAACPEMIDLAELVATFATLLRPRNGNSERLDEWIATARAADLPHLHAFTRGLDFDRDAVHAAVTLPYHNGGTEGVNTKTKRIMRQMHGRVGFALSRRRILLG